MTLHLEVQQTALSLHYPVSSSLFLAAMEHPKHNSVLSLRALQLPSFSNSQKQSIGMPTQHFMFWLYAHTIVLATASATFASSTSSWYSVSIHLCASILPSTHFLQLFALSPSQSVTDFLTPWASASSITTSIRPFLIHPTIPPCSLPGFPY